MMTEGIMKKILQEFKEFISRGSVVDLAVGVIVGGAFSKIVTSLVNDILMPIIGIIIGGLDFSSLSLKFRDATIMYGAFIQNVIDFLIVAACIFMFVKIINSLEKIGHKDNKKKEEPAPAPKKSDEIILLEEIRDLLKNNTTQSKEVKTTKKSTKKKN